MNRYYWERSYTVTPARADDLDDRPRGTTGGQIRVHDTRAGCAAPPIALCEDPEIATLLVTALNSRERTRHD